MSGSLADVFGASFNEIPYDIRKPGTYVEVRPVYQNIGLVPFPAKAIMLGQFGADALAAPATTYRITRDDQAIRLFGRGSMLTQQVIAFRRANASTELHAAGLPALAGGAAAVGTIDFFGTGVPAPASVAFYVAGRRAQIVVRPTDTGAQQAANLAAAINNDPDLPVIASVAGATLTLTARQAGECGNAIDLRVGLRQDEERPPGFAATVTPMAGGAGNPDVTPLLARIASTWFTDISMGWTDAANMTTLTLELAQRYTALGRLDAHAWVGLRGSVGLLLDTGSRLNSPFLTAIGATRAPTPPWEWGASLAGVGTFALTNDPARQLRTLVLPRVLAQAADDLPSPYEQDLLLRYGISTFNVLSDGTVTLDRVVTTYQRSPLDVADTAWLDVMTPKTMTRIRYDWASFVSLTYPRHKLADDGSVAATSSDERNPVVTPRQMHNSWAQRCRLYAELGWIENIGATLAASEFARDASDKNRLNGRQEVETLGNLMVLAASLEFRV